MPSMATCAGVEMGAYLPTDAGHGWILAAGVVVTLLAGVGLSRLRPTALAGAAAWVWVLGTVAGTERLAADQPAGVRMLALIGVLLYGMKAVVTLAGQREGDA